VTRGRAGRAARLVGAAALAACSGDARAPAGGGAGPAAAMPPAAPGGAAGAAGRTGGSGGDPTACPHDGRWRACSVAERLERSGLVPRPDSGPAPRVPFFSVPAARFRLGRGAVHAFIYDDTARLARDVAALDTVRVAPRGGRFDWDVPPTFVRSANLVAVLLTANEHQIERVRLALEAGPPQRDPDRP
jgi:hypothetical protein